MLAEDIYQEALKFSAPHHATDIRIGLGYTAVVMEDGRCGLGYTLREQEHESCTAIPEAGELAGRSASELIAWIKQPDEIACAVGLAAINALLPVLAGAAEADILKLLSTQSEDVVGMIGYFGPLVAPIRKTCRTLHIFERKPIPDLGVLPDSAAAELLPQCHVVVISATTLLNRTMEDLLHHCTSAREIAILGPSTPFLPQVFKKRGVTILSGVQIVDAPRILRIVSEAGGTRKFGSAIRKLTLRI
jgi:uncharacterized protein